jgi:hypothetical protein
MRIVDLLLEETRIYSIKYPIDGQRRAIFIDTT